MIKWLFLLLLLGYSPWNMAAQGVRAPVCRAGSTPGLLAHSFDPAAGTFLSESPNTHLFDIHILTHPLIFSLRPSFSSAPENLLPKWTPEVLPFFCRVEHDWGKKMPFAFKFRLGSVEYVDWLEGKSAWTGQ